MTPETILNTELRIFVYGTLKQGFSNHERYCRGLLRAEPAYLAGRLFKLSARVPVMTVADEQVLGRGSADVGADMELQEKLDAILRERENTKGRDTREVPGGSPRRVCGELLYFGDPVTRLPSIDLLEEFRPGRPSTYNRVLASVTLPDGSERAAWVYIAGFDIGKLEEYKGETWFPD
jgi:gamma-glutamylcyclotransferase (GGCT)/AIG2-like uncharacterized protein YtfP